MSEGNSGKNFWFGFFIGGLVGGFVIFLLGTKEGKKLAAKLQDNAELFEDDLEEKVGKLQKRGEDLVNDARDLKDRVIEEVEDKKNSASEKLVSKMDDTLTRIEDIQKKGVELTREVHHKFFRKNGKKLAS